jgi:hypothetical protein
MYSGKIAVPPGGGGIVVYLGREILLLGSVRESIMTPSETSSEKTNIFHSNSYIFLNVVILNVPMARFCG